MLARQQRRGRKNVDNQIPPTVYVSSHDTDDLRPVSRTALELSPLLRHTARSDVVAAGLKGSTVTAHGGQERWRTQMWVRDDAVAPTRARPDSWWIYERSHRLAQTAAHPRWDPLLTVCALWRAAAQMKGEPGSWDESSCRRGSQPRRDRVPRTKAYITSASRATLCLAPHHSWASGRVCVIPAWQRSA